MHTLLTLQDSCQAEVGHLHLARLGDHDVLGLDVAVDDLLIGGLCQGRGSLAQHEQGQFQIERAIASQVLLQIHALDVLLRDEVYPVDAGHVVDLNDVGMDQRGRRLGLTTKSLHARWIRRQFTLENLQRHLASQRELLGQIDLGHGATAKPAQHVVVA